MTLPIVWKPDWACQAGAKWAVKAWRVFCHWSTTGKRLTVSTEQCSGSGGGKKALWLGSKDHSLCQHSCPAGVSFRAAPDAKATTNLSLRQPGTQGHKGVNAACRGEGLSSALTELYTSWSVLLHVQKWFNWLVYLDRGSGRIFWWIHYIRGFSFENALWFLERFPAAHSSYPFHAKCFLFTQLFYGRLHMLSNNGRARGSKTQTFWSM